MAPRVDPVTSDTEIPARTSVVVVGGGIIGTSTAFFLARKGIPVVLCEKGHIAGEQSSRNWGWCRKMARDPRDRYQTASELIIDLERSRLASPVLSFAGGAAPLLPAPIVTSTQGKRSFRQPLGFSEMAVAALQSVCCHIW